MMNEAFRLQKVAKHSQNFFFSGERTYSAGASAVCRLNGVLQSLGGGRKRLPAKVIVEQNVVTALRRTVRVRYAVCQND
jgi:hypothetical protein